MNIIIKDKNLFNLNNLIKQEDNTYRFNNKGKSIEFLDDGIYLIYFLIVLNKTELLKNIKIDFLINKKFNSSLIQLNKTNFLMNKIIKITNKDIISLKNKSDFSINMENINIKICKL